MNKIRLLVGLFGLQAVLTLCIAMGLIKSSAVIYIATYLPLILLVLHAVWTLTWQRGLSLICLASFVGFVAEAFSLHFGTLFGGDYIYSSKAGLMIWGVPVNVIVYWAIFIYMGYWLVTSFLRWKGYHKPAHTTSGLRMLIALILADGLAVTAIDLFMDPISTKNGSWTWLDGGPYFGVPIGNFIGWFAVTVIVTGIFRLFEYYRPLQRAPHVSKGMALIPVIGYLLVSVNYLLASIAMRMPLLSLIGAAITTLPALINITLARRATNEE